MLTFEPLKIPPEAFCRGCGYALRELTVPRCPECGRLFDPQDPLTWTTRASFGGWLWWQDRLDAWARAPTIWELAATLLITVLAVIRASMLPARDNDVAKELLLSPLRWFGAILAVRLLVLSVRGMASLPVPRERGRTLRFLCMPLCGVALLLAMAWCDGSLAAQRRCLIHRQRLVALCGDSLKQQKPLLRRIGSLGMVIAAPQPGGAVQLTIDLDYYDRWSSYPRHILYDPAAGSAPSEHDPLWPMQGFFLKRSRY